MCTNVIEGPKIKRLAHRFTVMFPEKRLDVRCEAEQIAVRRSGHSTKCNPLRRGFLLWRDDQANRLHSPCLICFSQ